MWWIVNGPKEVWWREADTKEEAELAYLQVFFPYQYQDLDYSAADPVETAHRNNIWAVAGEESRSAGFGDIGSEPVSGSRVIEGTAEDPWSNSRYGISGRYDTDTNVPITPRVPIDERAVRSPGPDLSEITQPPYAPETGVEEKKVPVTGPVPAPTPWSRKPTLAPTLEQIQAGESGSMWNPPTTAYLRALQELYPGDPQRIYRAGVGIYGRQAVNPLEQWRLRQSEDYSQLQAMESRLAGAQLLGIGQEGPLTGQRWETPPEFLGQYAAGGDPQSFYNRARDILQTGFAMTPQQRAETDFGPGALTYLLEKGSGLPQATTSWLGRRIPAAHEAFEMAGGVERGEDFFNYLAQKYNIGYDPTTKKWRTAPTQVYGPGGAGSPGAAAAIRT